jgi:hypothetical protein
LSDGGLFVVASAVVFIPAESGQVKTIILMKMVVTIRARGGLRRQEQVEQWL